MPATDPHVWLAQVLERIDSHKHGEIAGPVLFGAYKGELMSVWLGSKSTA